MRSDTRPLSGFLHGISSLEGGLAASLSGSLVYDQLSLCSSSIMEWDDYDGRIGALRKKELPSSASELYLDASGYPPVPRSTLDAVHNRFLSPSSISNPHSQSPSGQRVFQEIEASRSRMCHELFHVRRSGHPVQSSEQGWELVFNSGTTAGLQLVAQSFAFNKENGSKFAYFDQSHTSLYGIRDIVQQRVAAIDVLHSQDQITEWVTRSAQQRAASLLALPLQCNATGKRYNDLVDAILRARQRAEELCGYRSVYVLLDVAAFLSSATTLPLEECNIHQPDFFCFSFYKILGYPSGLGGMLLQRGSFKALASKVYYGGGTLDATTSKMHWRAPISEIAQSLEDGTQNVYAILALIPSLESLRRPDMLGSWYSASSHLEQLTIHLYMRLASLKHANGSNLIEIYSNGPGRWIGKSKPYGGFFYPKLNQGPVFLFNVLRPFIQGSCTEVKYRRVDPAEVDKLACLENIHLRSGRMCNIGAITSALGIPDSDIVALWERGIGCGAPRLTTCNVVEDHQEEARLHALVNGALRVSLSAWSTRSDIEKLCNFLQKYFAWDNQEIALEEEDEFVSCRDDDSVDSEDTSTSGEQEAYASSETSNASTSTVAYQLRKIYLYPIKSCTAQNLHKAWKLTPTGLQYDRSFCIVDLDSGKILSQKRVSAMALIRPEICLNTSTLRITFCDRHGNTVNVMKVSLTEESHPQAPRRSDYICGTPVHPSVVGGLQIQQAFSSFLGRNCTLARMPSGSTRNAGNVPLLFSNESPYLMVTSESVAEVCHWIRDTNGLVLDEKQVGLAFRPNFVISKDAARNKECGPFYEDEVEHMRIGPHTFTSLGPCRRCEMIALNPVDGSPLPHIFSAVARHRRCKTGQLRGRILFGQHFVLHGFSSHSDSPFVEEGMMIQFL